ncbi:MAG: phosphoadenylyl-sulfate reductase [Acidimicrobiaceae bacterium]|nr:phosphoadenylyl-sulfate reductase [Acidimicrobiaceae bacterium]
MTIVMDQEILNTDLAASSALTTLHWARQEFGDELCLLSSMQDAVLIDLAMQESPAIDVFFLDTGYHFAETLETLSMVEQRYGITVTVIGPPTTPRRDSLRSGECCDVKPSLLDEVLKDRRAWLTGARRAEADTRAQLKLVSTDRRNRTKISPLAQWSDEDVSQYIQTRNVITNPLIDQGYPSIGCALCTTKPLQDQGPRSGRWGGTTRTECGLHL